MPYEKRNWISGMTPMSKENLEAMDVQIFNNTNASEKLQENIKTIKETVNKNSKSIINLEEIISDDALHKLLTDALILSALTTYLEKHPIEGTGANGKDGIGIKNIKINSNGELVITYTDDKEANVGRIVGVNGKNGVDGKDGYSPVLGVDYYTEKDKAEINADNIEFMTKELAKRGQLKPEFANTLEECTDTSKLYVLPDGYIYGYTLTEIMSGGYENKAEPLPNNTTDTALWVKGYRIGSGGTPSAQDNTTLSNYITCTVGDVIRVKGVTFRDSNDRYALYKADNSTNGATYVSEPNASYATVNQIDDVYEFTIVKANTAFIRFAFQTPTDSSSVVITVNEEIVEATTTTEYAWKSTGHAFVPADYENRIVAVESEVAVARENISALTEDIKVMKDTVDNIGVTQIPDYWKPHLTEKIERISELQKLGGKDTFTFPVFADTHYTSNLGKIAPLLAKEIMDKVHSKFAVDVGDAQTRGCHANKGALEEENALIGKMFEPVRDRLLRTEGNHDGAYGKLDKDGDGAFSNHYSDGTVKPYNERETYVHNLTQAELFECIYRENGLAKDVHCDSSGTAYYVDDTLNKARFVVLNTHKNDYELNADGTQKYPKMWLFHYTQEQFDFLINEALKNGLTDEWAVMVFAHCPVTQEISDRELMQGVLRAFKNKTAYKGNYAGDFSYDAVSVDVDFSNAKGEFVGYFHGHNHVDSVDTSCGFNVIGTRCDAKEENDSTLKALRIQGTVTEQSFDVFTVNKAERKVYATKIGAGEDRTISY